MWFFFNGVVSASILATCAVAIGFVVLWFFVWVAQGGTLGSIFFAIAIQRAAARVNQDVPGQMTRFIVEDFASADLTDLVKWATDHFSRLAAELGSANHKARCKIVVVRASQEASCQAGYEDETGLVDGIEITGKLIADPLTAGGQRFIEDLIHDKASRGFLCRREAPLSDSSAERLPRSKLVFHQAHGPPLKTAAGHRSDRKLVWYPTRRANLLGVYACICRRHWLCAVRC